MTTPFFLEKGGGGGGRERVCKCHGKEDVQIVHRRCAQE